MKRVPWKGRASSLGVIYYGGQSKLGTIEANTEQGIFGTIDSRMWKEIDKMLGEGPGREPIPIGYRQDVKKGPAFIRSCISGEPRDYAIEIQKVDYSTAHKNKSLVIKVTDPELLSLTGGIVQGMSGSPIIQDGKLIGAVPTFLFRTPPRDMEFLSKTCWSTEAGEKPQKATHPVGPGLIGWPFRRLRRFPLPLGIISLF